MKKLLLVIAVMLVAGNMVNASQKNSDRNVAVLSNIPMNLTLCDRSCNDVISFEPVWKRTGRGFETTIRIPKEVLKNNKWLRLIREDKRGYSTWDSKVIRDILRNDVPPSDAACVGGHDWCAVRGL